MNLAEAEDFWSKQLDPGLRQALGHLEERKHRVLESKYFLGHTNEEGAAHTGEALATYKRLVKAALEELRGMFTPQGATM